MKKILFLVFFIASTNTYAEIYKCDFVQEVDNLTNKINKKDLGSVKLIEIMSNQIFLIPNDDKKMRYSCNDMSGELLISDTTLLCRSKNNNGDYEFNKINKLFAYSSKLDAPALSGIPSMKKTDVTLTYNCKVGKLP